MGRWQRNLAAESVCTPWQSAKDIENELIAHSRQNADMASETSASAKGNAADLR